jgi:hypothetical protein
MMTASNSNIARGGKAIYGAPLGILMLEARFPRIPGDMGNATTWPFPVPIPGRTKPTSCIDRISLPENSLFCS